MTTPSFVTRIPTWAFALTVLVSAVVGLLIGGILGAAVSDLAGTSNTVIIVLALLGTFGPPAWLIAARRKRNSLDEDTNPTATGVVGATEQSGTPPQLSRKMQIAILLVSLAAAGIYNFWPQQDPYGLETRLEGQGGIWKGVTITNIKKAPIKILEASINERKECIPFPTALPAELKEGDQTMLLTACEVMRLIVKTEKGTVTYTFK